jgi:hypothetical protein
MRSHPAAAMTGPVPHPSWEPRLVELLQSYDRPFEETGAEVEITWPEEEGGATAAYALARHYRLEKVDGELTLWLRPIVGGYDHGPAAPRRAYHLNETRRHAFPADTIAVDPEANLRGSWGASGRFIIRPVSAERRAEVDAWDTFCYVHLEDHELTALEELREDSWLGGEWE